MPQFNTQPAGPSQKPTAVHTPATVSACVNSAGNVSLTASFKRLAAGWSSSLNAFVKLFKAETPIVPSTGMAAGTGKQPDAAAFKTYELNISLHAIPKL